MNKMIFRSPDKFASRTNLDFGLWDRKDEQDHFLDPNNVKLEAIVDLEIIR